VHFISRFVQVKKCLIALFWVSQKRCRAEYLSCHAIAPQVRRRVPPHSKEIFLCGSPRRFALPLSEQTYVTCGGGANRLCEPQIRVVRACPPESYSRRRIIRMLASYSQLADTATLAAVAVSAKEADTSKTYPGAA
jgi:hypothetical protein